MTLLQALDRYYGRMADRGEAEDLGFTRENISFSLTLNSTGEIVSVTDLRVPSGRRLKPARLSVPRPKRTSNIQANFLWDKTAYAFGVDTGKSKRLSDEHSAFKSYHREMLSGIVDNHASAFLAFLDLWRPERFAELPFTMEMLDTSFVFRLDGERTYFHEVPALRGKWLASLDDPNAPSGFCLVSGAYGAIEEGHPIVKAVDGAQTAGAYLVSFNADAYTSYGKLKDATNAPTSKTAASRYGAALNAMLDRSTTRNRLTRRIGDATVVYWADTSPTIDEGAAEAAEGIFASMFSGGEATPAVNAEQTDDADESAKLRDALEKVTEGRPVEDIDPRIVGSTEFHVLGLSPNAARLSVRYWLTDRFDIFVDRLGRHFRDLLIEPRPRGWGEAPSVNRLLANTTALLGKFDNIPDALAGEVMRSILSGTAYPRTWLAAAIIRLRAGDDPGTGWHAAAIRACINRSARNEKEKLPVALEPDRKDEPYQLGRLFAVLEGAQYAALGRVNAPIGDRYYAAASSTPARVFGPLLRGLKNHVSDARKRGRGGWIEPRVAEIMAMLDPELPRTLKLEEQGRFAVGYYHEKAKRWDNADSESGQAGDEQGESGDE